MKKNVSQKRYYRASLEPISSIPKTPKSKRVEIKAKIFGKWKNFWFPTDWFDPSSGGFDPNLAIAPLKNPSDLNRWLAKIQFSRIRTDITNLLEALDQAEHPIFPFRWQLQQVYQNLLWNAHFKACSNKRNNLTLQKRCNFFENGKPLKNLPPNLQFIQSQWWRTLRYYILQTQYVGYNLIALGDMVNGSFPDIHIVKRQNISPDRENVTPVIGMVEGIHFNNPDEKAKIKSVSQVNNIIRNKNVKVINFNSPQERDEVTGEPFCKWHIWVTTKNDYGASSCGYGSLLECAPYLMFFQNACSSFAEFCEVFGQPIRELKTDASGDELNRKEQNLMAMGSNNYIIGPKTGGDELTLHEAMSIGAAYKCYHDNIEINKKLVTALMLGHEDAMSSIPGRLGSAQNQEESPQAKAIREVQSDQTAWESSVINDNVIPKLRELGFDIPENLTYGYMNNEEESDAKKIEDQHDKDFIDNIKTLADAGFTVSPEYISQRLGVAVERIEEPLPVFASPQGVKPSLPAAMVAKLKNIYSHTHVSSVA